LRTVPTGSHEADSHESAEPCSAKPKLPGIGQWAGNSRFHGPMLRFIEFIDVRRELFRPRGGDETIRGRDETIFRLWCRTPETAEGYQAANQQRRIAPAA
jgi:hypothetical protein